MIKHMIACLFLLHLCFGHNHLIMGLRREIIERLRNLTDLSGEHKINITSPIREPGKFMMKKPHNCTGVFIEELDNLLNNVTSNEHSKDLIEEVRANLKELATDQKSDKNCKMKMNYSTSRPFAEYARFLRSLNNSKRR